MNYIGAILLLFLLSAFAIGITVSDSDINKVDQAIDNLSVNVSSNIESALDSTNHTDTYAIVVVNIVEEFTEFIYVFGVEVMRAGIHFGHDNPDYFSAEFIVKLAKFIAILIIIALLIKPVSYFVILIVLGLIWIKNMMERRRKRNGLSFNIKE